MDESKPAARAARAGLRLAIVPFGMSLGLFLAVTFALCVVWDPAVPSMAMRAAWVQFLPAHGLWALAIVNAAVFLIFGFRRLQAGNRPRRARFRGDQPSWWRCTPGCTASLYQGTNGAGTGGMQPQVQVTQDQVAAIVTGIRAPKAGCATEYLQYEM